MGNTFGNLFRVTTFGESHGPALGAVIDGCPAGLRISQKEIQAELDRRRPGQSSVTTARSEADRVKILSGIFEGRTLGTPIALLIENFDARSSDYKKLKKVFRHGHADFAWEAKYGFRDYRGGGRSSGRETVCRVAAGAIAKKLIGRHRVKIFAYALQIGPVKGQKINFSFIEKNPVRAADKSAAKKMEQYILKIKREGDSTGGIVEIIIKNAPKGLGEPVFDKFNADLAKALCSIPAVKGIEFGTGFSAAELQSGKIRASKNSTDGISGGISTGEDIIIRVAVKPPSSISMGGRHDPCIIPRFIPVAESMAAITIADHMLRNKIAKI